MADIAISLPFSITPYGSVASTTDPTKIWADRVRSVLGTALRERVMRSEFGTLIPFALFESEDNAVAEVEAEVQHAFDLLLPLLTLDSTDVFVDEYTNVLTVNVVYSLPNNKVVFTTVGLAVLDGASPIYQEIS